MKFTPSGSVSFPQHKIKTDTPRTSKSQRKKVEEKREQTITSMGHGSFHYHSQILVRSALSESIEISRRLILISFRFFCFTGDNRGRPSKKTKYSIKVVILSISISVLINSLSCIESIE